MKKMHWALYLPAWLDEFAQKFCEKHNIGKSKLGERALMELLKEENRSNKLFNVMYDAEVAKRDFEK